MYIITYLVLIFTIVNAEAFFDGCRPKNSYIICSDQGVCLNNKCNCDIYSEDPHQQRFNGTFCECKPCPRSNNRVCGDYPNMKCKCGKCKCVQGWTGADCNCSTRPCYKSAQDEICYGRGGCVCGKCVCKENYYGENCERYG